MDNKIFQSSSSMMWHFLKPCKSVFVIFIMLIPLSVIASLLIPWYMAKILNLINDNADKAAILQKLLPDFLKLASLLVIATAIGIALFLLLQYKCIAPVGIVIRRELFSGMLKKDSRFWNMNSAGNIWSKIDLTRRSIASFSSLGCFFYDGYATFCSMVISVFLLAKISLPLACCFSISGGIVLALYYSISNNIKKVSVLSAKFEANAWGKVTSILTNFFILKAFGTERKEQKNLEQTFDRLTKAKQKKALLAIQNSFMREMLLLAFYLGIIFYAIYLWTRREIFAGDIVYVMAALSSFCKNISVVSGLIPMIKSREEMLKENIKVFALENEFYDVPGAKRLKVTDGAIEFKNLRFSYDGKKEVLKNITFSIKPREKIGIVGISGSGKTTLLSLLLKLINTPRGMVFIDNQDITELTAESIYAVTGFIPQDISLFHRTVLENIKYGKLTASYKAVKKAASAAFADNFIGKLPLKYNTLVGDKGIKLSGGERQRISIARAILKDAPILILDEATSALDSQSENYIQQAIEEVIKDKTVIAVAHRLSTLRNMDRIVVLEDGQIVEEGKPEDLLKKKGKFFKLWNLQKVKK